MQGVIETFFTRIGCMDGRVQLPVSNFGKEKFDAMYPDSISDAGEVGILAHTPSEEVLKTLQHELDVSLTNHHSKGIVVHGHQECAGNPVDDDVQKLHILRSVELIKGMVRNKVPVVGIFVKRQLNNPSVWEVEEL
jgi:carbonic anhydrase